MLVWKTQGETCSIRAPGVERSSGPFVGKFFFRSKFAIFLLEEAGEVGWWVGASAHLLLYQSIGFLNGGEEILAPFAASAFETGPGEPCRDVFY